MPETSREIGDREALAGVDGFEVVFGRWAYANEARVKAISPPATILVISLVKVNIAVPSRVKVGSVIALPSSHTDGTYSDTLASNEAGFLELEIHDDGTFEVVAYVGGMSPTVYEAGDYTLSGGVITVTTVYGNNGLKGLPVDLTYQVSPIPDQPGYSILSKNRLSGNTKPK